MDRRRFMQQSIIGVSSLSALTSARSGFAEASEPTNAPLTAGQVHAYLRRLGNEWIDPNQTVDTFKSGDPDTVVTGIAVGWMSYFQSLRQTHEGGLNLFITHEPTYYSHRDDDASVFAFDAAAAKRQFIKDSGIAIIRCHDVWDRVPEIGIRDAWARFLGFDKEIDRQIEGDRGAGKPFCGVYEIAPRKAEDLARHVAGRVVQFQQEAVQLIGPPERIVRTVAVGTGAITPFREMVRYLQPDVVICSDDGFSYWRDGGLAIDMQQPVIIVNHACTEEVSMRALAAHLASRFPQVPVHHIAQPCMYRTIRPHPAG